MAAAAMSINPGTIKYHSDATRYKNTMKNILIYSHDTYGLGNIRRTIAIANQLVDSDTEKNVLILSGSPVVHSFRLSSRIDYVKLPCLARSERNQFTSKYLDVHNSLLLKMRTNIVRSTVRDFEPDLIMVDKNPCGIANEFKETLNDIRHHDARPEMVLLLRDILDEPVATKRFWNNEGYDDVVCENYDRVLVVGEQRVYDLAQAYDFSIELQKKIHYCGYIERSEHSPSIHDNTTEYSNSHLPLVLVMAGGGQDGFALLKNYLLAKQQYGEDLHHSVVISGPELSQSNLKQMYAIAEKCPNTEIIEFTSRVESYIDAAEVLVCMGGYNTVCEAMTYRKKTICVPRNFPVSEQIIRARRFEELGLLKMIHPDQLSPESLASALAQFLKTSNPGTINFASLNLDGLQNVTAHIDDLLTTKREIQHYSRVNSAIASA